MTAVGGPVPRPSSETTSASAGTRRADIQGLRALAVLMVVAYHAGLPVPGGFIGVDVFFVISGFVITAMLMREWQSAGRIRLGRFYVRRFKRLTPALALTVAVTMLLGVFFLSPLGTQQDTARTGVGAMLLVANLVIAKISGGYFDLDAETNALLNTWSLSVEEQFYLVFPALLITGFAIGNRHRFLRWSPSALVLAVGALSFIATMLGASGYVLPRESWLLGFYSPLTRAWEFAAGAALALFAAQLRSRSRRITGALAVLGIVLLSVSLLVIDADSQFPGVLTVLPVAGTMALIQAGSEQSNAVVRALSIPPMVRIGDWSYSIYLWHWPLIVMATARWAEMAWVAPVAALLSILPAVASYRWVETPLRRYTPPTRLRLAKLVAITLAVPLILSVALWQSAAHGFGIEKVQSFQAAIFAQPDGCSSFEPLSKQRAEECTWNPDATGAPIYLLGDSNAGQFVEAVVLAGRNLDRPVTSSTTNACPFVKLSLTRLDRDDSWDRACRGYSEGTLAFLSESTPGTVIVSNIDTYWDSPRYAVRVPEQSTDADQKLVALSQGLSATVDALESAGHQVILIQTVPRWSGADTWRTASCTLHTVAKGGCVQEMPVSSAEGRQGPTREVLRSVSTQTGSVLLDFWPALCAESICSTHGPGFPRYYRDGLHISVPQALDLVPDFTAALSVGGP